MLAIPLVVAKAMLTRLILVGLIIECWYTSMAIKSRAPDQYQLLAFSNIPTVITIVVVIR